MTAQAVFIETTVFGLRVFGRTDEQIAIERTINSSSATSSGYVREQVRSTFQRSAIALHAILVEKRDLPAVLRALDEYPFQPREGARARMILATLMDDQVSSVEDKISRLERWIEWEILDCVEDRVLFVDGTSCCLCDAAHSKDSNGFYRLHRACALKPRKPCAIDTFWSTRQQELQAISTSPCADAGFRPIRDAAAAVLSGKPAHGQRCWAPLSDAVIAAEAPDGSSILTTNMKDFVPLTQAISGARTARNPIK